jgi:predicted Rossmann fold nucleotide-binding protein DprA/Smf involved in DNA uptake
MTAKLAEQRNRFVAALSDELFVIHAGNRTGTFTLAVETMRVGKRIFTLKDAENQALIEAGAVAV